MILTRSAAVAVRLTLAALLVGTAVQASANETQNYTYDALGRLTKVARSGTVNDNASECYAYDPASNRSNVTVATSGDCGGGSGGTVSFAIASNGAVTEGATSNFTITKTGTATTSLSVTFATANGTAVAPGDYTAKAATVVTFLPTDTTKPVSVTTINDTVDENAENFSMTLSSPTGGATITTGTANATINDNDSTPTCTGVSFTIASDAAITEGTSSVFTITKSGTASGSCNVSYASANATATAGSDYTATSGTKTFASTTTSQTVNVPTTDDASVESPETFTMALSGPTGGAALGTPGTATATINDNDGGGGGGTGCSSVSFASNDASGFEGDALVFTITKSGSTSTSCSVSYAAENSSATTNDYAATSGTLTFGSTQTSQTVSVGTNDDFLTESTELLLLRLSNATAGAAVTRHGTGTIYDNDSGLQNVDPGTPSDEPDPADPLLGEEPTDTAEPPPPDTTEPPPPDATVPPPPGGAS